MLHLEPLRTIHVDHPVHQCAFGHSGERLLLIVEEAVELWDPETCERVAMLAPVSGLRTSAGFSPADHRILIVSSAGEVGIWDGWTGALVARPGCRVAGAHSACFGPNGHNLLLAPIDSAAAQLLDAQTGATMHCFEGPQGPLWSAAFSPDGRYVATGSEDGTTRLWDVRTGREVVRLLGHQGTVWGMSFDPSGERIITCGVDATARLWRLDSAKAIRIFRPGEEEAIRSACFALQGRRILGVCDGEREIGRVWNAETGDLVTVLDGLPDRWWPGKVDQQGRRLANLDDLETPVIWDLETGRPLRRLVGHVDEVHAMAFNFDGTRLVTASSDRTTRLWNAESGEALAVLEGHEDAVWSVCFSASGESIASGSRDGNVRIWRRDVPRLLPSPLPRDIPN